MRHEKKIFLGVKEYAGYYSSLFEGLRQNNHSVDLFLYSDHPFGYETTLSNNKIFLIINFLYSKRQRAKSVFSKLLFRSTAKLFRFVLLIIALARYDIFIMSANSRIFSGVDFFLIKLLKRKLIITCHGSDVRPIILDKSNTAPVLHTLLLTLMLKIRIWVIERNSDYIVNELGTSGLFRKPYIAHRKLGIPTKIKLARSNQLNDGNEPLKVIHCPSNLQLKGTSEIKSAIANIQHTYGYNIDFEVLSGLPHKEILEKLEGADLLIDQLYSDVYLATLGIEACWLKTPVIVGSSIAAYKWEQIYGELPCIYILPEKLEKVLIDILEGKINLEEVSKKQYQHVESWTLEGVANRYELLFRDEVSDFYYAQPEIGNTYGIGLNSNDIDALRAKYGRFWAWGIGLK